MSNLSDPVDDRGGYPDPPPRRLRAILLAVLGLAIAIGVVLGGHFALRRYERGRLQQSIDEFLAKRDLRSSVLSARQLLSQDPANQVALRALIVAFESVESPEALVWHRRMCEARPGDDAPRLAMAATAIRLGEYAAASQVLDMVSADGRNSSEWLHSAAMLAEATGSLREADQFFSRALIRTPDSALLRVRLAALRMQSTALDVAQRAREELEALTRLAEVRLVALQLLYADAERRGDVAQVARDADRLALEPNASVRDKLPRLELLHRAKDPAFEPFLAELLAASRDDAVAAGAVISRLARLDEASRAMQWTLSLDEAVRDSVPVRIGFGEACISARAWTDLRKHAAQEWPGAQHLRWAMQARAHYEIYGQTRTTSFRQSWQSATSAAGNDYSTLLRLASVAALWGMEEEAVELWWLLAARPIGAQRPLTELNRYYSRRKDTRQLARVARRAQEIEPPSPVLNDRVVRYSLLLGEDLEAAHELARQNHKQHLFNPAFAATWAWSLYVQGRFDEARDEIRLLPGEFLAQPTAQFQHGAILAACGEHDKAGSLLERALASGQLLPEEEKIAKASLK